MLIFYKYPSRGKEKMMINVFYKNRNTIGQFMVALIFLGTFGFLFTFDGFVSKSQASGCCGGGEAAATSFAADSSGDYSNEIPMGDAPATDSSSSNSWANSGKYCNKVGIINGVPQNCNKVGGGKCEKKCIKTNKCKKSCG